MKMTNKPDINQIYQGDWVEVMQEWPDGFVDMCITSPPYWALRDYGVEGQLGLESTFEEYIDKLCSGFDEIKRVLKGEGTCWVNMGDTYSQSGGAGSRYVKFSKNKHLGMKKYGGHKIENMPAKCLVQIPYRFAIEMVNRGWILRNTIIWHKPNCMPESVKDRFTVDFEYIFLFSRQKDYYFEQQFEPMEESSIARLKRGVSNNHKNIEGAPGQLSHSMNQPRDNNPNREVEKTRNKRTVWTIPTKPFPEAHFAVYPEELIETPIKAGCPKGGLVLDPFMGAGTTAFVARKLGRSYIGVELNEDYIKIAEKRLAQKHLGI